MVHSRHVPIEITPPPPPVSRILVIPSLVPQIPVSFLFVETVDCQKDIMRFKHSQFMKGKFDSS